MTRSKISFVSDYSPELVLTSKEIEDKVNKTGKFLPENIIEQKFGVRERRFAGPGSESSDLAVSAALKILEQTDKDTIDCLIFASGSSDLIEPATSNIIQSKLKLSCPCFDVKNACNSFVSGLQVADAFIVSGQYKKILAGTATGQWFCD